MEKESIEKLLKELDKSSIRFTELLNICEKCFGESRSTGGSHFIFKTPWKGDPRINLQKGKGGKAKEYQVQQVRQALLKLLGQDD